ncbi:hypothetical protein IEQ34_023523 [Dendrobium chrysotoxum]|uniref:Uncharacterized protein n=1 Tax=Dendrobium chrysotoxum TaxID=161865 RepID=A0AAV7FW65_DENCH|nr:hypothetical protein IEQ34_023523 [Dendrobium chrysotoxum]
MNSHRTPGKERVEGGTYMRTYNAMHYRRMIITLKTGSSIPPLIEKRTSSKRLNNTAIHFSKTSNPSTRNGAVDSQVKSNQFELW